MPTNAISSVVGVQIWWKRWHGFHQQRSSCSGEHFTSMDMCVSVNFENDENLDDVCFLSLPKLQMRFADCWEACFRLRYHLETLHPPAHDLLTRNMVHFYDSSCYVHSSVPKSFPSHGATNWPLPSAFRLCYRGHPLLHLAHYFMPGIVNETSHVEYHGMEHLGSHLNRYGKTMRIQQCNVELQDYYSLLQS